MGIKWSRPSFLTSGEKPKTCGFEVIKWIELHCRLTTAEWYGRPFKLLPWQKRLLLGLFAQDPATQRRLYRWAYVSVPKKNGKTELMAALALWFLIASEEPSPLVVCAAGSDDQADLLFSAAKTMVEASPTLSQICQTFEDSIVVPSIPGAKLQRVSATARKHGSNLDGKNIYVVIADELHVWEGTRGEIVWGTLTRGTGARREPMIVQITTAGYDRDSICWKQYQHAKKVIEDPAYDPAFFAFIAEMDPELAWDSPEAWADANPSYGEILQPEFYRDQITKQPENEFKRYYENVWTESQDSWLPAGAWDACRGDATIPDGSEVWVGVDMALYHDSTAVVVAWPDDDGRVRVQAQVWHPQGDRIDHLEVMQHIRDLAKRYTLREVNYDPRFFEVPAQQLMDEGFPMLEVPQSSRVMVPACGWAWEQIVAGNVVHGGQPELTAHVQSAAQRTSEHGWTLSKGKSKGKIDACIAMVLALWRVHAKDQADETPEVGIVWV